MRGSVERSEWRFGRAQLLGSSVGCGCIRYPPSPIEHLCRPPIEERDPRNSMAVMEKHNEDFFQKPHILYNTAESIFNLCDSLFLSPYHYSDIYYS